MSWLLDTCVICEPIRARPAPRVLTWLRTQSEESFYLSVLTLGEIRKGAALLPAGPKRRSLEKWLEHELPERFAGRILPVDTSVADLWARITARNDAKGRPLPTLDTLIAATALDRGLVLVTRNTRDFEGTDAELLDPWQ